MHTCHHPQKASRRPGMYPNHQQHVQDHTVSTLAHRALKVGRSCQAKHAHLAFANLNFCFLNSSLPFALRRSAST